MSEKWYARETVLWKHFHLDYIQGSECDSSQGHESNGKQGDETHHAPHFSSLDKYSTSMYVLVDSAFDGHIELAASGSC